MTTYTPQTGLTPQGAQVAQGQQTLADASPINFMQQDPTQLAQQASQAQANMPQFAANDVNALSQQIGLPGQANAYGNLVSQYASAIAPSPTGGVATGNFLAAPQGPTQLPGGATSYVPMLTPGNAQQPFAGVADPAQAASLQSDAAGAVSGTANNLWQTIQNNLSALQSQHSSNMGQYSANVQGMQTALQTLLAEQNFRETQREFDAQMGLNQNPLAGSGSSGGGGGNSEGATSATSGQFASPIRDQIAQLDQAIQGARTVQQQKAYQDEKNQLLGQIKLGGSDATTLSSNQRGLQQLQTIESALTDPNTVKRLKNVMGNPLQATMIKFAINSGNAGMLEHMGLNPQDYTLLSNMALFSTTTDRTLLGGRVTGYLLDRLSPITPNVGASIAQNKAQIQTMKVQMLDNLKYMANNNNITLGDLLGNSPVLDYIKESESPGSTPSNTTSGAGAFPTSSKGSSASKGSKPSLSSFLQ